MVADEIEDERGLLGRDRLEDLGRGGDLLVVVRVVLVDRPHPLGEVVFLPTTLALEALACEPLVEFFGQARPQAVFAGF